MEISARFTRKDREPDKQFIWELPNIKIVIGKRAVPLYGVAVNIVLSCFNLDKLLENNKMENEKTILYIDDEPALRELIQEVLTKGGYKVAVAEDGEIGLIELEKNYYDLVLLDIIMPKMSGIDVLKRINAAGLKHGKIVIFTNLSLENTIKEAFELGADGYEITTTITPDNLVSRVNEYLSGTISKEESKKRALEVYRRNH